MRKREHGGVTQCDSVCYSGKRLPQSLCGSGQWTVSVILVCCFKRICESFRGFSNVHALISAQYLITRLLET